MSDDSIDTKVTVTAPTGRALPYTLTCCALRGGCDRTDCTLETALAAPARAAEREERG